MTISDKTLYYFTASYPYGFGEQWKKNELDVFSGFFKKIIVVPLSYEGNLNPKPVPGNVVVMKPILAKPFSKPDYLFFFIAFPFSGVLSLMVKELIQSGSWYNWLKFKAWFGTSLLIRNLFRNKFFKDLNGENKGDILYFFWGTGLSHSLLFLKKNNFSKIVVRFHGVDLYEARHASGYIPYRAEQLKKLDLAAMISNQGRTYIYDRYPAIRFTAEVYRLGCLSKGLSRSSEDGVFRIVTCSAVVKGKRLAILSKALALIDRPVIWKHIGDGELRSEIEILNKELPPNIETRFIGKINSEKVLNEYVDQFVDLFINVSDSEGVPVSIMEAFSAGIPVLATDVGGTSEIVNSAVGTLIKADLTPVELMEEIKRFMDKDKASVKQMREKCFEQYMENCNAGIWANRMAENFLT